MTAPAPESPLQWGRWLVAAGLLYVACTVAFTWPLCVYWRDHVRAASVIGWVDLHLHLWTLAWVSRTVVRHPLALFDANAFYPAPLSLAGSDHLLGALPVAGPVYWITQNPVATLNAVVLSSFPLAGLAAFALVAAGTRSGWAGLLAGVVYAFVPWRTRSFVPVQTFTVQYLPLVLLAATAYLRRGRRAVLVGGVVALILQLLVAYYVAYTALAALAVWLAVVAAIERPVPARRWLALGLGVGVALVLVAAMSWPYVLRSGAIRVYGGALGTAFLTQWLGTGLVRRADNVFVGVVPLGLAALACLPPLADDRRRRVVLVGSLALALGGWLLCLGAYVTIAGVRVPLPFAWLAAIVPGFASMRTALRFFTMLALGLSGLAGIGLTRVRGWCRPRLASAVATGMVAITLWEYRPLEWPMPLDAVPVEASVPEAYRWLAAHGTGGPLLEMPVGSEGSMVATHRGSRAMYLSTVHWLPLLNGYTAYPPRSHTLLMRLARTLPDAESLQALVNLVDVRWVLLHLAEISAPERAAWLAQAGLLPVARFGTDVVLRVTLAPNANWRRGLTRAEAGRTASGTDTAPLPATARRGRIEAVTMPETMPAAGADATVRVVNLGPATWPGLGQPDEGVVTLTATWDGGEPSPILGPKVQTISLPRDLPAGGDLVLSFPLRPPGTGAYQVTLALRQGAETFPEDTAPPLVRPLTVLAGR